MRLSLDAKEIWIIERSTMGQARRICQRIDEKVNVCCVDTRVVDVEKIEASRPAAVLRAMEAAKGLANN